MNDPVIASPVALWPLLLSVGLGLVAIYYLLPRPRGFPSWLGALFGALAVLCAGWLLIRVQAFTPEVLLFYVFSGIAIVAGGMLVTQRSPVYAALSFALVVLSTCGLFLLQAAPFLMAATIIVYAGAIVVTFLFLIMLAQQAGASDADQRSREPLLSALAGFVLLGALLYVLRTNYDTPVLDAFLAQARRAAAQDSTADILAVLGDDDKFLEHFQKLALAAHGSPQEKPLADEVMDVRAHWDDWKEKQNAEALREALVRLERKTAEQVRGTRGVLQPHAIRPLSRFSMPEGGGPEGRRDAHGRLVMPAENTVYLGRTLFTDYLLAVELAGTLLLVATIGAIAITSRRTEGLR